MTDHRKPAAFRLDDPHVVVAPRDHDDGEPQARARRAKVLVTPAPETPSLPAVVPPAVRPRRRFPWGTVFWSALGSLTLESAIERHKGEAEDVTERFFDLTEAQKQQLFTFLNSL